MRTEFHLRARLRGMADGAVTALAVLATILVVTAAGGHLRLSHLSKAPAPESRFLHPDSQAGGRSGRRHGQRHRRLGNSARPGQPHRRPDRHRRRHLPGRIRPRHQAGHMPSASPPTCSMAFPPS